MKFLGMSLWSVSWNSEYGLYQMHNDNTSLNQRLDLNKKWDQLTSHLLVLCQDFSVHRLQTLTKINQSLGAERVEWSEWKLNRPFFFQGGKVFKFGDLADGFATNKFPEI